jgi:hypothetical protein
LSREEEKGGLGLSTPGIERTSLKLFQLRRDVVDIERFRDAALIPLKLSPRQKLLGLQNDQAYITMMGFDTNSFDRVLEKFGPMFSEHLPF